MQLRVGYELIYDCPQPTPMMLMLNIHHSRANDIVVPDVLTTNPSVPLNFYRDTFGNWCTRIVAPPGQIRLTANADRERHGYAGTARGVGPAARRGGSPRGVPAVSARQPLLRNRPAVGHGLVAVRQLAERRAAGAGDLRLRASAHHVRLRERALDENGVGGLQRDGPASAATSRTWRSRSAAA